MGLLVFSDMWSLAILWGESGHYGVSIGQDVGWDKGNSNSDSPGRGLGTVLDMSAVGKVELEDEVVNRCSEGNT